MIDPTTHKGPTRPDDLRVSYYGSRYYCDTLPADDLRPEGPMKWNESKKGQSIETRQALPAQSTVTKAIPADALLYWAVGKVAEYAVDERSKWQALDREDAIDLLKKAHSKNSGAAADRGTSIHEAIEALLEGNEIDETYLHVDALPYLPVVRAFFENEKPELVVSEVVGIGEGHGVTTDAIVRLASVDGLSLVDWKSRSATVKKPHVVYEKEVAQLGANLDVRYWIVESIETGEFERAAVPENLGAVLVTFSPTSYAIHEVDPVKAVEGWREVVSWSETLKRLPEAAGKPRIVEVDSLQPVTRDAPDSLQPVEAVPVEPDPVPALPAVKEEPLVVDIADSVSAGMVENERKELRRRMEAMIEAGHEEKLVAAWPLSVGLGEAPDDTLAVIEKAIGRAEAAVGMPFDPPPSEPVAPKPKPEPVRPKKIEVEEGPDVGDDDVETVRAAFLFVEEGEPMDWIKSLAERAGNLSIAEKRSARRLRIGYSLCRLAVASWHDDDLLAAVLDHSGAFSTAVEGSQVAELLSSLGASGAKKLSDTVSLLVADEITFSVSPDTGRMRLVAS